MNKDELNELLNKYKQCVDEYMNTLMKIARREHYIELYHLARKECVGRAIAQFIRHKYGWLKRALYSAIVHCFWLYLKCKNPDRFISCVNYFLGEE